MQWLFTLGKIAVAALLITWLVASGKFDLSSLQKITDPQVWLTSLTLFSITLGLNSWRWQQLLAFENIKEVYKKIFALSLIGIFFNFVIPGGVGGDVVKGGYLIKDHPDKKWFVGWSVLIDRVFGLVTLLLISAITGLLFYKQVPEALQDYILTLSLLILIGFVVGVALLFVIPQAKMESLFKIENDLLKKVFHTPFYFFKDFRKVLVPFAISILSQCFNIGIFYSFALLTGVETPLWVYTLLVPIGLLSVILPIAPAGLGVGQTTFYFLFEKIAGNGEFGVLLITFVQLTQFIIGCLGGIVFILYSKKRKH